MSGGPQHIGTEDLSAYIDGAVDEPLRAAIADHLAACSECRAELSELRATVRLLNALPALTPARSFRLGPEHARKRPAPRGIVALLPMARALSVAAAIALLVVTGAFLFDSSTGDEPTSAIVFSEARSEPTAESARSEDAASSSGAGSTQAGASDEHQGGLTDRGNAASAGEDAMPDAPLPNESQPAPAAGAAADEPPVAESESDSAVQKRPLPANAEAASATAGLRDIPWGRIAIGLAGATMALGGLWAALAWLARSPSRRGT